MKMTDIRLGGAVWVAVGLLLAAGAHGQDRVSQTVHNLSVSGPGAVRAQAETQVCIFCHAPHNTSQVKPLWNRAMSVANYTIYQSSTLDALPGQPTGSDHTSLINFDTTIVFPLPGNARPVFQDLAGFAGSCTLTCHGEDHDNETYGVND